MPAAEYGGSRWAANRLHMVVVPLLTLQVNTVGFGFRVYRSISLTLSGFGVLLANGSKCQKIGGGYEGVRFLQASPS